MNWIAIDKNDSRTWPEHNQRVTYFLEDVGEWDGRFKMAMVDNPHPYGWFESDGGFLDWYEVQWKPR